MFQAALNYPRNSDSTVKNVAIGGVLLLFGFLFVPALVAFGYVVQSLRRVMDGVEEPPEFEDWGALLTDGAKAFAIGLAYSLVPAVIAAVAVLASGVTLGLGGNGAGSGLAVGLIALVAALLVFVVSLVAAYVVPAAIVAWVRTDSLGAAFSPRELRELAFSKTYATGWLVAVGIALVAGIISSALGAVFIGTVLVPFVTFYANVAGAYAIGSAVREMPVVEAGSDAPASQPAA